MKKWLQLMRFQLRKRSKAELVNRIIPGAKRRGITVTLFQKRRALKLARRNEPQTLEAKRAKV
jgi:hypothetical protein